MRAFAYLVWTSWRNRIMAQLRRARSPRYAIALVVGVLYLWGFLFRPRQQGGDVAGAFFLGPAIQLLAIVFVFLSTLGTWVFGSDLLALAFSEAEVSMLFPAPLSRRALIGYKLFRAQIAVLINALIWVFIMRRGGTALPSPLRAAGLWVMFTTLNLHRLGAALVRASWAEHKLAGLRRHGVAIVLFALVVGCVAYTLFVERARLIAAVGPMAFLSAVMSALAVSPARLVLYPFHAVIAPSFARTIADWGRAMLAAVVLLVLHTVWVLRTDTAFEEAAVEASAERARRLEALRQRRSLASTAKEPGAGARRTIPLAATGRPALAIVWKNTLCLFRTAQLRVFIAPLAMGIVFGVAMSGGRSGPARMVATIALALVATLFIFGWRMIRNDLRHDMLHLPLLKTLPVSPSDIVLAEVASATLPLVLVQLVVIVIAYVAIGMTARPPLTPGLRLALLVASPFVIGALSGAMLTIQNGTAVLFPAWIRLGPTITAGVEALGQNVLSFGGAILCLLIGLIVPVVVGGFVYITLRVAFVFDASIAIGAAAVAGSLVLAAETYGVMRLLGRVFARAEPAQTQ